MTSLVHSLQADLIGTGKSITDILRTAKLISGKLGLDDISAWLALELAGYKKELLPDYRTFRGGYLQVRNPSRGWMPVGFRAKLQFPIRESVPTIEEFVSSGDEHLVYPLSEQQKVALTTGYGSDGLINSFEQRYALPMTHFKRVLEAVKEKVLDWTIELEGQGILGENMTFGLKEKESAKTMTFNIQNFTGVLGDVSGSQVQIYNYSSIHQQIKDAGVPKKERDALEEVMDELQKAPANDKQRFLDRAKAWVVKNEKVLGASVGVVLRALGLKTDERD